MLRLLPFVKTFYIKPTERGILFHRSDFKTILTPGTYSYFGGHWNVKVFDVQNSQLSKLELSDLDFLLQEHRAAFEEHCEIVSTTHNEVALVKTPAQWYVVGRNEIAAFWRGWNRATPVVVHRFDLNDSREVPEEIVEQIYYVPGLSTLKFVDVTEDRMGLLYDRDNFIRLLPPGRHGFWDPDKTLEVLLNRRLTGILNVASPESLIKNHPEFVSDNCLVVELMETEVAIARDRGNVIDVLGPSTCKLYWQGVTIERINTQENPKLSPQHIKELVLGRLQSKQLSKNLCHAVEVPQQSVGLYYESGALTTTLEPGWHGWWTVGRVVRTEVIDLRLQVLEVSGQEILSKDKVALRLNLTASYRVTDPVVAYAALSDVSGFLYKELQFALRGAIGTKTLDELLEDKGAIDGEVLQYIQQKTADYGIEIISVGVKDIILPGEMKTILAQVVEAEKSAQANVIRRREETSATRSMLNTARVMENNPMAMRLKELEVLERITENIDSIEVRGGLNSLLSELVTLREVD